MASKDERTATPISPETDIATMESWMIEAFNDPPNPDFWLKLVAIMHEASEVARRQETKLGSPGGLLSIQSAIHDIAKLFSEQPYFMRRKELCAPLFRLSIALLDLNHGRVSWMFKPSRGKGNPGQASNLAILKGIAARAMKELVDGGTTPEIAAKTVAEALRPASERGLGKVNADTVINWRERFNQGASPGAPPAALHAYMDAIPPHMGETAEERGKSLVAELRKLAAELI